MITCANKREGMRNEVIPHEVYGIFDIFLVYQVEPNVTDPISATYYVRLRTPTPTV